MNSPFTGKEMSVHKEWRSMSFRKEEFVVLFHAYKCEDTGDQFEDEVFAQLNYDQLVNQYRAKYAIPFIGQIIEVREKYEVSAARMSEILGYGANGYRQYENGEVPSQSNARLIQLASDPHEFRKLVDLCRSMEQKAKDKLYHRIQMVLEEQKNTRFGKQLETYFFQASMPSPFTGYKMPSLSKFAEMVVFFAERLQPWKTKLNKLLFYADFTGYKQSGFSISGAPYKAIPMGPVPNNYDSLFEYLSNNSEIEVSFSSFPDGGTGEQFKPHAGRSFRPELFTTKELAVLENVAARFKDTATNEIIALSHNEKAWTENITGCKLIDYKYSFDLNG